MGDIALPVRIPVKFACNDQGEAEMQEQTARLRDWQMYSRLSDKGCCLMTLTPEEDVVLEAVYAQVAQADDDDAVSSCSALSDDSVFVLDF